MTSEKRISEEMKKFLHHGSIVFLKIHKNQRDISATMASDGFVLKQIFLNDFQLNKQNVDFYSSLFLVVPHSEFQVQQSLLEKIKTSEAIQNEKEMFEMLEQESRAFVNKFNKLNRTPVPYYHPFQLMHIQSNRFLTATIFESSGILKGDGITLSLEDISSKNSVFTGIPCYEHQPDQNKYLRLNEEIYIASSNEGKYGYLYWPLSKQKQLNEADENQVMNDILISNEHKTQFKIKYFCEYNDMQTNNFYYGDWIWILLDVNESYLAAQVNNNEQAETFFLKTVLQKIQSTSKASPTQKYLAKSERSPSIDRSRQEQRRRRSVHLNSNFLQELLTNNLDKVVFQSQNQKESQETRAMWKIEGKKIKRGGKIKSGDPVRFRNCRTGKYLSVRETLEGELLLVIDSSPDDQSLFQMLPIQDSKTQYIESDNYFLLKHVQSSRFIGIPKWNQGIDRDFDEVALEITKTVCNPVVKNNVKLFDVFSLRRVSLVQMQETHFLLSCTPIIQYGIQQLKKIQGGKIDKTEDLIVLQVVKECVLNLFNFCFAEGQKLKNLDKLESSHNLRTPNFFRQQILREQGLLEILTNLIKESFNCKQYLNKIDLTKNFNDTRQFSQGETRKRRADELAFFQTESRINGVEFIIEILDIILQKSYQMILSICKDNYINQIECFKLFHVYQHHIGENIGAEDFIISILKDNKTLLFKLHVEDIGQQEKEKIQSSNTPRMSKGNILTNLYIERIQTRTIVHSFIQKFKLKQKSGIKLHRYNPLVLKFLNTICCYHKVGITINQLLISELLNLNNFEIIEQESSILIPNRIDQDQGKLILRIDSEEYELKEFVLPANDSVLKRPDRILKSFSSLQLLDFLQLQLQLLGNLCYGRNYFCKKILKDRYPVSLLLIYIKDVQIPFKLRSSLIYMLIHTHIDTKPRIFNILPHLNYVFQKQQLINKSQMTEQSDIYDRVRIKISSKSVNRRLNENEIEMTQQLFSKVPDMVDEFFEEKDTVSDYQLQQITDFVRDYMDVFGQGEISQSKDKQIFIRYDDLTLQVVYLVYHLMVFDCFYNVRENHWNYSQTFNLGPLEAEQLSEAKQNYVQMIKNLIFVLDHSNTVEKKHRLGRRVTYKQEKVKTPQHDQSSLPDNDSDDEVIAVNLITQLQLNIKKNLLRQYQDYQQQSQVDYFTKDTNKEKEIKKEILRILQYKMKDHHQQNLNQLLDFIQNSSQMFEFPLEQEQQIVDFINNNIQNHLPVLMKTGIKNVDDAYGQALRSHNPTDIFSSVNESSPVVPVLMRLFYYSQDPELDEMSLSLLLNCYNQKRRLLKDLKYLQIMTDPDDIKIHQHLKQHARDLQFLVEKSEIWFGTPKAIQSSDFKYKFVIYQFLDLVKEFNNFQYNNTNFDDVLLINKPKERNPKEIDLVRQNMCRNLYVHQTLLEFLRNNSFLLNDVNEKNKKTQLFLNVFENIFQFFFQFSYENIFNKKILNKNLDTFLLYKGFIEMGQTQVVTQLTDNMQPLLTDEDILIDETQFHIPLQNIFYKRTTKQTTSKDIFWKLIVINILLSPQVESLVQDETLYLVRALTSIQRASKQDESEPMQLHKFLGKLVGFLANCLDSAVKQSSNKDFNMSIIFQCLHLFYSLLHLQTTEEGKHQIQKYLTDTLFIPTLLNFICLQVFTLKDATFRKIYNLFIEISIEMLDGGNTQVQMIFYEYFISNPSSERFFQILKTRIEEEISHKSMNIRDKLDNSCKGIRLACNQNHDKGHIKNTLRFIQLLCENHMKQLQMLIRFQKNSRNSVDLMEMVLILLEHKIRGATRQEITYNLSNFETLLQCFDCLTEMIQGPCPENQISLSEGNFLELAATLIQQNDAIDHNLQVPHQRRQQVYTQAQNNMMQKLRDEQLLKVIEKHMIENIGAISQNYLDKFLTQYNAQSISFIWMLSRVKYKCLIALESMLEGQQTDLVKHRIMHSLPIEYLRINLLWIYDNFKQEFNEVYSDDLLYSDVPLLNSKGQTPVLVLESGFKVMGMINKYENINIEVDQEEFEEHEEDTIEFNPLTMLQHSLGTLGHTFTQMIERRRSHVLQEHSDEDEKSNVEDIQKRFKKAQAFFKKYTLHIEIVRDNKIFQQYFPKMAHCDYLPKNMKDRFNSNADRANPTAKIKYLIEKAPHYIEIMKFEYDSMTDIKNTFKIISPWFVQQLFDAVQTLSFIIAFAQNILILSLKSADKQSLEEAHVFQLQIEDSTNDSSSPKLMQTLKILQYIQISISGLMFLYVFKKLRAFQWFRVKSKIKRVMATGNHYVFQKAFLYIWYFSRFFLLDIGFTYYLIYCIFALLGLFNPLFSAFLLLDIFRRVQVAKQIINALYKPLSSVLVTLLIFIIVSYYFCEIIFLQNVPAPVLKVSVPMGGSLSEEQEETFAEESLPIWSDRCNEQTSLLNCFVFILDKSFKDNAGFISQRTNETLSWDLLYDFLYIQLMIQFVTQILGGLIIDTFGALRENEDSIQQDMQTVCYICGLERQVLERYSFKHGFERHIADDHNLWNYMFYISYIQSKKETEYTGIESYVRQCLDNQIISWFPIEQSLKLNQERQRESRENNTENKEQSKNKQMVSIQEKITELNTVMEQFPEIINDESEKLRQMLEDKIKAYEKTQRKLTKKIQKLNQSEQDVSPKRARSRQ